MADDGLLRDLRAERDEWQSHAERLAREQREGHERERLLREALETAGDQLRAIAAERDQMLAHAVRLEREAEEARTQARHFAEFARQQEVWARRALATLPASHHRLLPADWIQQRAGRAKDACPVCGESSFAERPVLWPALIESWGLNADEAALIDRQQGFTCIACGSNLRSMTLAGALLAAWNFTGTLREFVCGYPASELRVLELNGAGTLTRYLQQLPRYTFGAYPEVDMLKLPYPDDSFDIVIHSDTLEHVPDPVAGLAECRRVVALGGSVHFTIPIVPSRLTRRRAGLPPSFHHHAEESAEDYRVVSEYGADFYLDIISAGFTKIELFTLADAASVAIRAVR